MKENIDNNKINAKKKIDLDILILKKLYNKNYGFDENFCNGP